MLYFTELNTTKEDNHIKKYYSCYSTQAIASYCYITI